MKASPPAIKFLGLHLEPLEERRLLTVATTFVNDNWYDSTTTDGIVRPGDLLVNSNDLVNPAGIIATFGTSAFGKVTKWGANQATVGYSNSSFQLIHDAIQGTNVVNGTVNILEGTYLESDIVIDRPLNFVGAGQSGAAQTLIMPEVASSHADITNFGVGTHSGIIIYSPNVTVSKVHLDGSGNGIVGPLNYHHGITTLYDTQNGGGYNSLHNGVLSVIRLGSVDTGQQSNPNLKIDHVTVDNLFYHGITLSARAGESFGTASGSNLHIDNAIVNNVGDAGNQDASRIGILVQNLNDNPFASPLNGSVRFSTVTNAGVGIESTAFGTRTFGSTAGARNRAGLISNTVSNAVTRAYHIEFQDNGSQRAATRGNLATFSGVNTAVGLYLNQSQALIDGFTITGAQIGVQVQNSPPTSAKVSSLGMGNSITGPGTGEVGSVGLLIENSVGEPNSAAAKIASGTSISGFATGVRIGQPTAPFDGQPNVLFMDRPTLAGNAVGINVGNGAQIKGSDPSPSLTASGAAVIVPGFENSGYYYNSPGNSNTPTLTPSTADILNTGDATLNSSTTFVPLITGQSGSVSLFNFNAALNYPNSALPLNPVGGVTSNPNGAVNQWFGNVLQDGSGSLVVAGAATNGQGFDYLFGTNNTPIGGGQYQLNPTDLSGLTTLDVVAKKTVANQSSAFAVGLMDIRGNIRLYPFSFADLNTASFTTLRVNLLSPGTNELITVFLGPDSHLDLTKIVGFVIAGDEGVVNTNQNVPFGLIVDDISASGIPNGQLNVTGTVNLAGALLAPLATPGFLPTLGQQFTIVNNDAFEPVVGTFSGMPEGAFMTIAGNSYQISYSGGVNLNDVVLTRMDMASTVLVGHRLFYNQSGTSTRYDGNNLAINSLDDLAIATDKTAYLWEDAGAATFANVSSYTKGINGIMVDIFGSHPNISADDFIFRVGNNNSPGLWATANAPTSVSVRAGAGTSGSDRVTIIWNTGAPIKQWLNVIVLANADTGLAQAVGYPAGHGDAFFFGSAPGNTGAGDTSVNSLVTATDEAAIRANPALIGANIPITNIYDVGRNASVSALDESAARLNGTNPTTTLKYLNLTTAPAAPEADGVDEGIAGDGGVASALAAPATADGAVSLPKWISNRIDSIDLNSGTPARLFQHFHDMNTPRSRALLQKFDAAADALGLDDELLDALLADLNACPRPYAARSMGPLGQRS